MFSFSRALLDPFSLDTPNDGKQINIGQKWMDLGVGEMPHMQQMDMPGINDTSIQHDESVGWGLTTAGSK